MAPYDNYQFFQNYEKTNEKTNEKTSPKPALNQTPLSINKNVKKLKNEKNKPLPPIVPQGGNGMVQEIFSLARGLRYCYGNVTAKQL